MKIHLADEAATLELGKCIAKLCPPRLFVIHLEGELGAGKTTFSRGFYTLVERYDVADRTVFHFDLYRLSDPEELDYLGLDDYFSHNAICLLEWAKQGGELLPQPDLVITFTYQKHARDADLLALSPEAIALCKNLNI
jgi:tRNA threonylcarbamoyladenosine biosynthesis protein TsaE